MFAIYFMLPDRYQQQQNYIKAFSLNDVLL